MTTTDDAVGTAASAVRVAGVSKTFGGTKALDDVSFEIAQGSVHALLGGNGSGKSTLIKILAGVHQADEGGTLRVGEASTAADRITPGWAREAGLHFVHQAIGTFPDLSVAENFAVNSSFGGGLLAPIRWRSLHRQVQGILDRYEVGVRATTMMGDLRPATQTMVAVARALQGEESAGRGVLVLDEPTATLPNEEVDVVLQAIEGYRRRGHTVVLVTHRLDEVMAVCTDATFLVDGRHRLTRSLAGVTRAEMVQTLTHGLGLATGTRSGAAANAPVRLKIDRLAAGTLTDFSLSVRQGEIVGVSGLLGSGRSSLLRVLFGAQRPTAGRIELDGRALEPADTADAMGEGIAYVPEDRGRDSLFGNLPVARNLSLPRIGAYWRAGLLDRRAEASEARGLAERYGIVLSSVEAPISSLSGGNQQKVVIARWLSLAPRLLLLDEPTQGVDIAARAAIHETIRAAAREGCSVLVASSDADELAQLSDRVVGLVGGRSRGEVSGAAVTQESCLALAYQDEGETGPVGGSDDSRPSPGASSGGTKTDDPGDPVTRGGAA